MSAELDLGELVEHWTLLDGERASGSWSRAKRGATRLVFAVMLKFYGRHGRFRDGDGDLRREVVEFVARQVEVPARELDGYEWSERTGRYHRAQIREHFGYRECTVEDAEALAAWLAENVAERDPRPEVVGEELLDRCRKWRVGPPSEGRIDRIVRSAVHTAQTAVTQRLVARLSDDMVARIEGLVAAVEDDEESDGLLALVKSPVGEVSLETMLVEIEKLEAVRSIGLPAGLFADVAPRVLSGWRQRAAVETPSHLRSHPRALRLTLLAAQLHAREREITDTLVDLLIATVHRIGARAEKEVTNELIGEFKRIANKETLLFRVAEASVAQPDGRIRDVIYPLVGEATCTTWSRSTSRRARHIGARCRRS